MKKLKTIPPRFIKAPRARICHILIEELEKWESTTKVTDEEFLRLVDKLANAFSELKL